MADDLIIRRACDCPEDRESAVYIENSCFEHPWSAENVIGMLRGERGIITLFAELEGKAVGSICAWMLPPYECQIGNLSVLPDHRRRGIGKALLEAIEAEALKLGIGDITLEVRVSNIGAAALYADCGFTIEGVRKKYYENNEDALIMWKRAASLGGEDHE